MSTQSNDQGRAFEFITLMTLGSEIRRVRDAVVEQNSSYYAAERAWNSVSPAVRCNLENAAKAAVDSIFELEPLILEDGSDALKLLIQPDTKGKNGDVRDILIVRRDIHQEIGLSLKHNHFAVKHSRLAKMLDFGAKWYGVPCSDDYWREVAPIFRSLEDAKSKGLAWSELPDKEHGVYIPLLNAFIKELRRSNAAHEGIPRQMVEYLLGKYDFYKVISIDAQRTTRILGFNLRGTLNRPSVARRPKTKIPMSELPTRIVDIGFKPGSNNTIELYMDGGWQFSFHIHNASTLVETSLKFDVQIIGMPATIIAINCIWR